VVTGWTWSATLPDCARRRSVRHGFSVKSLQERDAPQLWAAKTPRAKALAPPGSPIDCLPEYFRAILALGRVRQGWLQGSSRGMLAKVHYLGRDLEQAGREPETYLPDLVQQESI